MKGKLIVIEGTDCSGKETQSKLVVGKLVAAGKKAINLSFPMYDTPTGKIIAGPYLGKPEFGEGWFTEGSVEVDPKIASLYYAADRKYNIHKVKKYIEEGYYVVLDRYTSSNMAHQGCKVLDKDERFNVFQWIDKLEYWLLDLPKADLTIFLHVPFEISKQLMQNRENLDQNEKDDEYLQNAERTYIELSELYHWTKIDCSKYGQLKTIEEINQEIITAILEDEKKNISQYHTL